jgi:hypothetical protein
MAWQALWCKEHHIDADIVTRSSEAWAEHFGRRSDAAQAIMIDGKVEIGGAVAPFDFDEGDRAAAPRNKVNLADGHAEALAQYAPAVETQPPGRAAFGAASACFRRGAVQACSFNASARA